MSLTEPVTQSDTRSDAPRDAPAGIDDGSVPSTPGGAEGLDEIVADARRLAPDFEAAREISASFDERLRRAGAYDVLVPRHLGGRGEGLVEWFSVVRALGAADASVGWCVAHGSITSAILAAVSNETFRHEFFGATPAVAAWSNLSQVEVVAAGSDAGDGELTVTGRWGFVTGCTNAEFVGGTVHLGGDSDASPRIVSVLVPRAEAEIDRVWDPVGLAGSGSHDVVVDRAVIDAERVFVWPRPWRGSLDADLAGGSDEPDGGPCRSLANGTWPIAICCAATQVGIAEGALDRAAEVLVGKHDYFSGRKVRERPHVLTGLEQAYSELVLVRSALEMLLGRAWDQAIAQGYVDDDLRLELRLAGVAVTQTSREIVTAAFDAVGSSALSRRRPLQRMYRDATCLTGHVSVSRSSFETTSAVRYGDTEPAWL